MGNIQSHVVPQLTVPQRLQEYGVGLFASIPTKSSLKKALKKRQIQVDGFVASTATIINGGETIVFTPPDLNTDGKKPDLELEVLFEDEYIAAISKPAGILVSGNRFRTIANSLSQNLFRSNKEDAVDPQPAHRLDYATTGVLLAGKTAESIRELNKLFENKRIQKTYYAVTIGAMENSGTITKPIDGKEAITNFTKETTVPSDRFECLNLVKLQPQTGRRHQLRIHMAGLGNPILGDRDYTPESLLLKGKGMFLHAHSVEFVHPFTHERLVLCAPIPKQFRKTIGTH